MYTSKIPLLHCCSKRQCISNGFCLLPYPPLKFAPNPQPFFMFWFVFYLLFLLLSVLLFGHFCCEWAFITGDLHPNEHGKKLLEDWKLSQQQFTLFTSLRPVVHLCPAVPAQANTADLTTISRSASSFTETTHSQHSPALQRHCPGRIL